MKIPNKEKNTCRMVRVQKDSPFYSMSKDGNITEPRLVMATHLGRILYEYEYVHQKDGDRHNVELSNLIILPRRIHDLMEDKRRMLADIERLNKAIGDISTSITRIDDILFSQGYL